MDGTTKLVGLIGWPVEHSLSPAMHNAAFDELGLNWRYVPLPVRPGQVDAAVRGLGALGFQGANVTVPHKQAVVPELDSVSVNAAMLSAVNTIVVERRVDGMPVYSGENSDVPGIIRALDHAGFDPEGKRAIVVGSGGAARAVVFALMTTGAGQIDVLNRTPSRAEDLVADLRRNWEILGTLPEGQGASLSALPLKDEVLIEEARGADLLVNATPVGMWPKVEGSIWPETVDVPSQLAVFDLVYNPLETRLLRQARESGANAIDGLGMLVEQGARSFELWTGACAPVDVMRRACEERLRHEDL